MIFVNTVNPYLRILLPDGDYAQFQGGKLELDPGDHGYDTVLAVATESPNISIMVNETTCDLCGESFDGKMAKPNLTKHVRQNHPDVYDAEQALAHARSTAQEVKSRAGYACDVCLPAQTFGTEDDLAAHTALLHTNAPSLDAEGNDLGDVDAGSRRRPGEASIPAAVRKG